MERACRHGHDICLMIYIDLPQCVTHNGVVRCVTLGIAKLPHASTHQIQLRPKEVKTPDPVEACRARGFVCLEFETVGYNMLQHATTLSVPVLHFSLLIVASVTSR